MSKRPDHLSIGSSDHRTLGYASGQVTTTYDPRHGPPVHLLQRYRRDRVGTDLHRLTMPARQPANGKLDADVLLAAAIEAVSENFPGDDADVIELERPDEKQRDQ